MGTIRTSTVENGGGSKEQDLSTGMAFVDKEQGLRAKGALYGQYAQQTPCSFPLDRGTLFPPPLVFPGWPHDHLPSSFYRSYPYHRSYWKRNSFSSRRYA